MPKQLCGCSSPSRQIRKQSGGCSLVSSRRECALGTSLTAPVRMPKIGTSGSMIVVLEKGQCDSHKIEIKISARVSISIFHATLPVNGARRGCHVSVRGGDRAIGGHSPRKTHSFFAGVTSTEKFFRPHT